MIVGEGPGEVEDAHGVPFHPSAPAGGLLTEILHELGVSRKKLYITNSTRCFKGLDVDSNTIEPTHVKACKPYLLDEIEKINPKYIVLAGNEALKSCLGHAGITKEHGNLRRGPDGRMYMPILHPAAALPSRYPEYRNRIKTALSNLVAEIKNEQADPLRNIKCNIIRNIEEFRAFRALLKSLYKEDPDRLVVLDLEANMLDNAYKNPFCRIGGVAFAWSGDEAYYLPVDHENPFVWIPEEREEVIEFLQWFASTRFKKANQNIKFDYNLWRSCLHSRLRRIVGDSMLADHLLEQDTGHGLEKIAWKVELGGYDLALEKWFTDNNIKHRIYTQVPLDILGKYGCGDAVTTYRAETLFLKKLEKRKQHTMYHNHVIPGVVPYADMEAKGLLVDIKYLDVLEEHYKKKIQDRQDRLTELAGSKRLKEILALMSSKGKTKYIKFNFNSGDQTGLLVGDWIRVAKRLKAIRTREQRNSTTNRRINRDHSELRADAINPLKTITITKNGRLSVSKKSLKSILANDKDFPLSPTCREFIEEYLRFKGDQNRLSNKVKGLRKHLCPDDRVRANYVLNGADTGRRSCSNPNLQNIPRERIIKRIFISPDNYILLMFDYKNLEVRIAAAISGDKRLLRAFNSGKDVHTFTASVVFRKPYARMIEVLNIPYDVVKQDPKLLKRYNRYTDYRAMAKLVMWTILFGGGAEKVSSLTGVTMGEAERTINTMMSEFPGLEEMFDTFEDEAYAKGYSITEYDRRRYLLGIHSASKKVVNDAIRQALNSPIQGSAAGICYEALTKVSKALKKAKLKAWPVQEVHDAITVEVHYKDAYKAALICQEAMESIVTPRSKGKIKFEVDASIGKHLGSKTKLGAELLEKLKDAPRDVYNLCMKDTVYDPSFYEDKKASKIQTEEDMEDAA